jgi:hypothetical protein
VAPATTLSHKELQSICSTCFQLVMRCWNIYFPQNGWNFPLCILFLCNYFCACGSGKMGQKKTT